MHDIINNVEGNERHDEKEERKMKMASARGVIECSKEYAYTVVYEGWDYKKEKFETMVYKRTNDIKAAERALKAIIKKIAEPTPEWLKKLDTDYEAHRKHDARIVSK